MRGFHLSPLMARRWYRFKKNKRGFWSLWIFLVIFCICLLAGVIANDKPLLVTYQGKWFFPVFKNYSETVFGGEFETETDYRDPFIIQKIESEGIILWPLIPYSYTTINYHLPRPAPSYPTRQNWFGTDDQGRDVLARALYGLRLSIFFAFILTFLSSVIGIIAGAVQGYFAGWIDLIGQRFIEIWSGLPMLYLLIILSSFVVPSFWSLLLIMLLFKWMTLVRVVRAEFLRSRHLDYVNAARALGVREPVIIFRHILPNALVSSITFFPFILNAVITTLTSLDFLGLGLPVGSPSLGELLAQGKANPQAPWLGLTGFIVLATLLSLLTFIGEGIRDAFDPRKV